MSLISRVKGFFAEGPTDPKDDQVVEPVATDPTDAELKADTAPANMKEAGNSGTSIFGGYLSEDHLTELQGTQGADIYAKMARSDYQVCMLLDIVKNPLLSADYYVEPVDDSDEEKEIAETVSALLFDHLGTPSRPVPFKQFVEEALTFIEHGFALFEVVNKHVTIEGKGQLIGLKKLGFRDQRSIQKWNLSKEDESLESVEQIINNDLLRDGQESVVTMDGEFLLLINLRQKGANYAGESMLRGVYGNWMRKNVLLKIGVIGAEKTAIGFPTATVPVGSESGPRAAYLLQVIRKMTTHESMGAVLKEGEKIESIKVEFDPQKLTAMVDAEDVRMTKRFLANFMELGVSGKGGAYSLGQDLSDIFFSTLFIVVDKILVPLNSQVVRQLVDLNYGPRKAYPKVGVRGLGENTSRDFAETLKILKDSSLVQVSEKLVRFIHENFKLPKYDEELGMPEEKPKMTIDPKTGLPVPADPAADPNAEPEVEPGEEEDDEEPVEDPKAAKGKKPPVPPKGKKPVPPSQMSEALFAEVNNTRKLITQAGDDLGVAMTEDIKRRAARMIAGIEKGLRAGEGRSAILANRATVPGKTQFTDLIFEALASTSVRASEFVAGELGVEKIAFADDITRFIKNAPVKTRARLKAQVDMIVESIDADLKKAVVFSFNNRVDDTDSVDRVVTKMKEAADRYVATQAITTAAGNAAAQVVNQTRNDIFLTPEVFGDIHSFIVTNPSPTALICKARVGRVISPEEYKSADLPPWHHRCETFLVAQNVDKANKRPIDPRGLTPDPQEVGAPLDRILSSITL